jgi:uncharacterized membrane protein YhaH (DUF805 family)
MVEGRFSVWKIVERASLLLGAAFSGICAFFAAATYYGLNTPPVSTASSTVQNVSITVWTLGVLAALAVALLVTGWAMMVRRRHDAAQSPALVTSAMVQAFDHEPEADISARDAYFQLLEGSVWKDEQLKATTDTKSLRRDWLEFRLKSEIHKSLRNERLAAWGEECLHGMVTTPEKPIPAIAWDSHGWRSSEATVAKLKASRFDAAAPSAGGR